MTNELEKLCAIMAKLRAEDGCGWDRKQTLSSLKKYLVEETYETLDAIDAVEANANKETQSEHCEELGDILLQIVFQSQIQSEKNAFDMADVCRAISNKLIRRHPHIFGDEIHTSQDTNPHWEKIKDEERARKGIKRLSALDGIPNSMPPFSRFVILDKKARDVGFDWPDKKSAFAKLKEEMAELEEVIDSEDSEKIAHELGDIMTACISLSRHAQIDPESTMKDAMVRFERRFRCMEQLIHADKIQLSALSLESLETYWQNAKFLVS